MKIAVTIWGNRISPVFDSSSTLLIVEIIDKKVVNRSREDFAPGMLTDLESRLKELGVTTIICGAISEAPSRFLETSGFVLIPFISGFVDDVIENLINEKPITPQFLMPGCRCQCQKRKGQRR